jgi:LacI family transcriptional regulator
MVTIETVASSAKVSTTTVSNVINGKTKRVSEATIQRVQAIIRETGYSPNMSARALSTRNSKVVALISHMDPEKSGDFMDDPFMTRFISAVESTLREKATTSCSAPSAAGKTCKSFWPTGMWTACFLQVCLRTTTCISP